MDWGVTIKAAQEKRRPGAGCGNVSSVVPGTRELLGRGGKVVISQAWRREREGLQGPAGLAPPRGYHLHFYRSRQPRATKKGKRGTMASFIRPDKDAASFQRRLERETPVFKRRKGRRGKGKKESKDWPGEKQKEMPVCGLQSETGGYGHTVTQSVLGDIRNSQMSYTVHMYANMLSQKTHKKIPSPQPQMATTFLF